MADVKRSYVLRDWLEGRINGIQASMLLGVSYRHALRLRRKFEREGLKGILRRKRGRKAVSEEIKREILIENGLHEMRKKKRKFRKRRQRMPKRGMLGEMILLSMSG